VSRDIVAERAEIDSAIAGRTVCSMFAERTARDPEHEALRWQEDGTWRSLTWAEYRQRVRDLTLALRDLGFGSGQFGMIVARNVPEHLVADLAIVHAGGAAISAYNTLAPEQIEYLANHSGASIAFVEDEGFLRKFLAIRERVPKLKRVVLMRGEAPDAWVVRWDDLLREGAAASRREPSAFDARWQAVVPEDLAALIYTSGTTGPPKGVMYTHRNVVWTVEAFNRVQPLSQQRLVSYLPLAHVAERYTSHWCGIFRGDLTYCCPDPAALPPVLAAARPTLFVGVPRVWEKFQAAIMAGLAADPDAARRAALEGAFTAARRLVALRGTGQEPPPELVEAVERVQPVFAGVRAKLGLDQCEFAVTSTAPLPRDVMEFFAAIGLPLFEVWGMSELTGPATAIPVDGFRIGSVGLALSGVEVRLAADGEILVRGGSVTPGYYREPERTAEAIDADGWMHTGDIGTVDADGYFSVVDRKRELIITSGGKNISPAMLEGLMKHHPLVGQAVAIGDGRRFISALVVLDQEVAAQWARERGMSVASAAELATHPALLTEVGRGIAEANRHVSQPERIKRFTVLPAEWTAESEELTPTLKLRRRVIERKYAAEIEAMYDDLPGGQSVEEAATAIEVS
jgi:long-chain acyl-CoA synthetase